MRVSSAVLLVLLVFLAGCAAVAPPAPDSPSAEESGIGTVGDVDYDQPLDADDSTEIDESELNRVVNRTMARLERERELAFDRRPEVEIITREEFRERDLAFAPDADRFEEIRWRATHIIGEDEDVDAAFEELYGGAVQGYYTTNEGGQIVLIVEDDEEFTLPRGTLVHELVHALQDQRLALSHDTDTTDEGLAWEGLIEGEADLLTYEYEARCESGEWRCVPDSSTPGGGASYNQGMFVSIFVGYGEGPSFVAHLRDRDGWDTVNDAYEEPPQSSAEIIEPERYPFDPRQVEIEDRSGAAWTPIETDGERRSDTLGAASLYAMFWYHRVIDRGHFGDSDSPSGVTYDHPLVTGWTGDRLVAYERGDDDAYVFRSTWTNATEAERFAEGYRELLQQMGAQNVHADTYSVSSDRFAGGYRIDHDGESVTVVHAPSIAELEAVHPQTDPVTASSTAGTDATVGGAAVRMHADTS